MNFESDIYQLKFRNDRILGLICNEIKSMGMEHQMFEVNSSDVFNHFLFNSHHIQWGQYTNFPTT